MKKIRKAIVKGLAKIGITPYVYYAFKWNDPFLIKNKLFQKVENQIIFDVGAFDGRSIERYKKAFPKSTIFSFEPTPGIYAGLEKKYAGRNDVKLSNSALSSDIGEASFHVNNSLLTNSLLESAKNVDKGANIYNTNEKIIVPTNTIDNYCHVEKIEKINILKIDVQGADLMVLKGAEKALEGRKIDLIFIEVEFVELYEKQPLFHDISAYLHLKGYHLYSLYNMSISSKGQLIYGDAVFISPDIKL